MAVRVRLRLTGPEGVEVLSAAVLNGGLEGGGAASTVLLD